MTAIKRRIKALKLNNNKKGFSLIELLVAVAVLAIVTPVLLNGFLSAVKLNYRSRLQQRVDAAANEVYEGIASVKYEELGNYLSSLNGWSAVDDGTGTGYDYYVKKNYDSIEDCEVKVAIQRYSQAYVIPDLNLVGVNNKYLTLSDEINNYDNVATEKIKQTIKTSEEIRNIVKQDIIQKVQDTYGITLSSADINSFKIMIDCDQIDPSDVSKQTSITMGVSGEDFEVNYRTSYRYPAQRPDPTADNASLTISYTYAHNINGTWESISNDSLNIGRSITTQAIDDRATIRAEKRDNGVVADQTMFIYYDPFSKMDWVDIKSEISNGWKYNVFFIEQTPEEDGFLNLDVSSSSSIVNNFSYQGIPTKPTTDYTTLPHGSSSVDLYSNNKSIAANGIPDAIYESTEEEASMYRVQVTVTHESKLYATVTGNFRAGGDTVGNNP